MKRIIIAVLAGFVFSPFYAGAAYAASLTVAVKQVNPDSAVQTITCELLKPGCDMSFVINAGQPTQQSLNIHVAFIKDGLALTFKTPDGFFYTDQKVGDRVSYNTLWGTRFQDSSTPSTNQVTLFEPLAQRIPALFMGTSQPTSIAKLEITATPNP